MDTNIRLINNGDEALLYESRSLSCKLSSLCPVLKGLLKIKRDRKRREYMKLYNRVRNSE